MQDMVQIRDFLVLHYKVTNRRDSPFWRHCAAMPIPDTLAQKIELFRETGRVFRKNEELFAEKDRKSTRLNSVTNAHLVCSLLREKQTHNTRLQTRHNKA